LEALTNDIESQVSARRTDFPGDHVVAKVEAMNTRDAQAMRSLSTLSQSISDEVFSVGQLPDPTLSRSVASENEVSGTGIGRERSRSSLGCRSGHLGRLGDVEG
jgi:hypothetical protein